jgi:hypothetical protein
VVARKTFNLALGLVRRSGLLPKSIPDGLGDEALLRRHQLDAQVVVYFADTLVGLYQLRPWYAPLRALHRVHPVVVVGTDSRAVAAIRRESGLPAYTISHYSSVDLILEKAPVRLALYVNHNAANFSMLSFTSLVHVSIMHGDSDKAVSVSGQTKAYDFTFTAGQAAVDRLAAHLPRFDAAARCVIIGRPQVEAQPLAGARPEVGAGSESAGAGNEPAGQTAASGTAGGASDQPGQSDCPFGGATSRPKRRGNPRPAAKNGRIAVLYAPTWEGGTASTAYSSAHALGPAIVGGLLADQRFRLVYRPHPLMGTRLVIFAEADARLRAMVVEAARQTPQAGHRVSVGGPAGPDLAEADLLVSDVSSLAIDFLAFNRPLAVTVPPSPAAQVAPTRLLETVPRLGREELDGVAAFLGELWETDPAAAERPALAEYYLGDTRPGAATRAFVEACGRMIDLAERDRTRFPLTSGQAEPPDGPPRDPRPGGAVDGASPGGGEVCDGAAPGQSASVVRPAPPAGEAPAEAAAQVAAALRVAAPGMDPPRADAARPGPKPDGGAATDAAQVGDEMEEGA